LVLANDIVPVVPPLAPSALAAEATADGVRLTWQPPPGEGPFRYNVYRARAGEQVGPRPLQREPVTSPEYLDADAVNGTDYTYEVRTAATDALPLQESLSSAPVQVRAEDRFPPAVPEKLVAVQEGSTVRLFWNPNQERDLAGYRVYRSVADGSFERIGGDPVERSSFIDADVRPGLRVAYRVSAVDRATPPNESAPSESVAIEVAADPGAGGATGP
jgi:fibronectin type 3 domain-containing protein